MNRYFSNIDPDSLFNLLQKIPNSVDKLELNIYKKDDEENEGNEENEEKEEEDISDESYGLYTNNNLIIKPIVPESITSLKMPEDFNCPLGLNSIPSTLKKLSFGHFGSYNQPLSIKNEIQNGNRALVSESILPKNGLTSLRFGYQFNQNISKSELPESLIKLNLGYKFNGIIEIGALPNSICHLSMGTAYSSPILPGLLPTSLTYLEAPINSNLVENIFPIGLKVLKFDPCCTFDYPILPGLFPMGIETIVFGNYFERSLENLPSSIKNLSIGDQFNEWSTILHLTSLETLEITNSYYIIEEDEEYENSLPPYWYCIAGEEDKDNYFSNQLKSIKFSPKFQFLSSTCIPPTVEEIIDCELENVKYLVDTNVVKLVINIQHGIKVDIKAKDIPLPKLKELTINNLDQSIDVGVLNHLINLVSFSFGDCYCHEILPFTFPSSLTSLTNGSYECEDQSISYSENSLPSNLIYLSMKNYNLPLNESYFPPSIKVIEFGDEYQSISGIDLPPNIETIIIENCRTNLELPLPQSLKSIYIDKYSSILDNSELYDKLSPLIKVVNYPIFQKLLKQNKTY